MFCPLCRHNKNFCSVKGPDSRNYFLCENCRLIFVDEKFLLTAPAEKSRTLLHNHDPSDAGHVRFLKRAVQPVLPLLNRESRCLDFGCGPVPLLPTLLHDECGITCDAYDPFFFPELPTKPYDFIFALECFEHFFSPARELQRLHELLAPQGTLVVMTELWSSCNAFKDWYYARDPSDVMFYHHQTFQHICASMELMLLPCTDPRVTAMRRL